MAKYGRNQAHKVRKRYLYALLFNNGYCYIGQTVNPKQREQQHHKQSGWANPFEFYVLGAMDGTRQQGEDYEFAWRYVAGKNHWLIYGLPPNIPVSSTKKMNRARYRIAKNCCWVFGKPNQRMGKKKKPFFTLKKVAVILILLYLAYLFLI